MYFKIITLIAVWKIHCIGERSVKKLLLSIQMRKHDRLNRVSSDGVARFGIHFKGKAVRISRKWLTVPQTISFSLSLSVWILTIIYALLVLRLLPAHPTPPK